MEKPKTITWQELKDFANSVPEEYLTKHAYIIISDESTARALNEPFFIQEDIYSNKSDYEDCGPLKELKELHGDEFNEDDYILTTKKGAPFLWSD